MNSDFQPPPTNKSTLIVIAGIVTAGILITGFNWLSRYLAKYSSPPIPSSVTSSSPLTPEEKALQEKAIEIALIDSQSMKLPGTKITTEEIGAVQVPYIPKKTLKFTEKEQAIATTAWSYFQANWNDETGLVNSVNNFTSVTLWDQAAAMAALVSAYELGLVDKTDFQGKMSQMLATLAKLPLYNQELPNKVYNSQTLMPVNYGQIDQQAEIGWSAIDLGRLAIWLKIVGTKYPEFQAETKAVWKSWKIKRLGQDGNMYGTSVKDGQESYNQEGRLGYENYAAYGLKLWGLKLENALDFQEKAVFVNLYDVAIPYDVRDKHNSQANNYVLSEPYFLDGIETGFQSLPKAYTDNILAAQKARYQATGQLTALTEDNLNRPPYFVYNTLFVNGRPWATINDKGEDYNQLRFLSAKAAIGLHVIYHTSYTQKLYDFVQTKLKSPKGWYNGFYENLAETNTSLTANNNGVILESMLYLKVGKPLLVWAKVTSKAKEKLTPKPGP